MLKWSITMNKARGGDGIPVELFQILKDDAVKMLHSICQQIWKTQQWPQDWKRSVFILIPKKGNAKECSNYHTVALISHASKVMLKILQARLQQYVNWELPDVQAEFRKGRGTKDQIANICWIIEKAREFQKKTSMSALLPKPLTVWITTNCGKFFKRREYQTTWLASWEICMQIKKQQLELYMEQWTGSKLWKKCIKAVYCHPADSPGKNTGVNCHALLQGWNAVPWNAFPGQGWNTVSCVSCAGSQVLYHEHTKWEGPTAWNRECYSLLCTDLFGKGVLKMSAWILPKI